MASPDMRAPQQPGPDATEDTDSYRSLEGTARLREFAFDDQDFEAISAQMKAATGINLPTSRSVDPQIVERIASVFRNVLG